MAKTTLGIVGATETQLALLRDPFHPRDLEWRIARKIKNKSAAYVFCYVTNRAIMDRLDASVDPANWQNRYEEGPDGGVMCGLGIRISGGDWVWKWDGAENTQIEAVKGGLSSAMKRVGVQWGIGRNLYEFSDLMAELDPSGPNWDKDIGNWFPPSVPAQHLPEGVFSHPEAVDKIYELWKAANKKKDEFILFGETHLIHKYLVSVENRLDLDHTLALEIVEALES